MKNNIETLPGYKTWFDDPENDKNIQDYTEALWKALFDPESLNSNRTTLYRIYALMNMCLKAKSIHYRFIQDMAMKDNFKLKDLKLCLFGKMIQKMIEAKTNLEVKKLTMDDESFSRYLYAVTRIILGKCMTELGEEILGSENELQKYWSDLKGGSFEVSLERVQYKLKCRHEATNLGLAITENWKDNELNVLCHDLEANNPEGTKRLIQESRDNIYQLHKRIRDKLKQTMADKGISEDAGRLFVKKYLKKICQNCRVLSSYKDKGADLLQGEKNE